MSRDAVGGNGHRCCKSMLAECSSSASDCSLCPKHNTALTSWPTSIVQLQPYIISRPLSQCAVCLKAPEAQRVDKTAQCCVLFRMFSHGQKATNSWPMSHYKYTVVAKLL